MLKALPIYLYGSTTNLQELKGILLQNKKKKTKKQKKKGPGPRDVIT